MAAVEAMLQDAGLATKNDALLRGCHACLLRVGVPVAPEEAAARVAVAASKLRHICLKVCGLFAMEDWRVQYQICLLKRIGSTGLKFGRMLYCHAELITLNLQMLHRCRCASSAVKSLMWWMLPLRTLSSLAQRALSRHPAYLHAICLRS